MECFNCKDPYNENDHCPRLLVSCGHSICEKCLKELYYDEAILCPECKTANKTNDISTFPKNLALVQLKTSCYNEKQKSKHPHGTDIMFETSRELVSICDKHNKKIEGTKYLNYFNNLKISAFCEKERLLLCITCILEVGHKSHELNSIQNVNFIKFGK